ncbi:MAG: hypothetical protein FJY85_15405, partial [Deltaproteobacteria bacterium]|nr:hypothetical protein [Deltaproteobacteria bacterium]
MPNAPLFARGVKVSDLELNHEILDKCDWDMEKFFELHRGTTAGHGSEFRPSSRLGVVVGQHPHFDYLREMLEEGFDYRLTRELSEEDRVAEFEAQLSRGNHQSAVAEQEEVTTMLAGDVTRGFVLPISAQNLRRLKRVHLQPCGIVKQHSLQGDGTRKLKSRLTHDLSFWILFKEAAINARVDLDNHPPMVYGWCLDRLLHYIVCLRFRNPGVRIYIAKFDYSDAYKRISHRPRAAAATVIVVGGVAYIHLRMAFGGSPNPAAFSCFSEMLTDLGNELGMAEYIPGVDDGQPEDRVDPPKKYDFDEMTPVAKAILPAVVVDTESGSFRDCFIDDVIDCHLGTERNLRRGGKIVPLAVEVMSRPHAGEDVEPIPRKPLLSPAKLEAEGRSAEVQIVLGWRVDTRKLIVSLPDDKFVAWSVDLTQVIQQKKGTRKE